MASAKRLKNLAAVQAIAAGTVAASYWLLDSLVRWSAGNDSLLSALNPFSPGGAQRVLVAAALAAVLAAILTACARFLMRDIDNLNSCELQYRAVLGATFDIILFLDDDKRVVQANDAASRAFGCPAVGLENRSLDSLFAEVRDPLPGGASTFAELQDTEADARHGPIQVVVDCCGEGTFPAAITLVRTHYGEDSSYIAFMRELTDEVNAREALRETQGRYLQLYEQMPIGIFRCLPDGTILTANRALLDILGVESLEDLVENYKVDDFYVQPEQRMQKLLGEGEVVNLESEMRRADGTAIATLTNASIDRSDSEHPIVFQGTVNDISDLRRTRDALRDSDETLRTLTENSLDMVLIIDAHGRIIYSSPSSKRFTGSDAADLIGNHVSELVHEDDVAKVNRTMRTGRRQIDLPSSVTCRVQRPDGSIVQTEAISRTFKDSHGNLRSVINVRDIGDRERTAVQLQHAQKMQAVGQLTGGIAHDFNNLLMVIVGNLQLLREQTLDPTTCNQIDSALQACVRGGDLTRRLLALARRQPLEPRIVDVNKLLSSIDPLLQRSLSKSMQIKTEYIRNPWLTKVDPSQLESALLNLAINSRDATSGEGELTVRTSNRRLNSKTWPELAPEDEGEYVCIEVADNGSGMNDDVLKRAVDPFFTTKADGGGSGLGLSMVYGFVQQSGGHMRIESDPGQGTRIEIYLPRTRESESWSAMDDAQSDMPFGGESILVVDDNDEVRNSAAALIKRLGYRVRKAASGKTALDMLLDEKADLVFSDIMMPEMSGFDLAEKVSEELPEVTILLTTGYADDSILQDGNDRRRFDILYKPYNQIELAKRIRSALDK